MFEGNFDPAKAASPDLLEFHKILHINWISLLQGKTVKDWNRETVFGSHLIVAREMTIRKLGIDEQGFHASPLPDSLSQLESKCKNCGSCCHFKDSDEPCQHLDKDNKCDIYSDRSKVSWCQSLDQAMLSGGLPDDCPYVKDINGYKSHAELAHLPKKKKKISDYKSKPKTPDPKILEQDEHVDEFYRLCLADESEEFNLALKQGYVTNLSMVPDKILADDSIIRNNDGFALRYRSIVCLRDDDNKILFEKSVELVKP